MDSESYRRLDRESIWHPYTDYRELMSEDFPVIEAGEGLYLYDVEGEAYLDAISSWWACNLGHGHPRLITAIQDQAEKLQHSILGNQSHPPAIELAERLVDLTGGRRRVHFASDGASAVEAALKISLQYWHNTGQPERNKFAYLSGDYHGDTLGAVSVGFLPDFHAPFDNFLPEQVPLPAPDCKECPAGSTPEDCHISCFKETEKIITNHSKSLAGVIVEPLCQAAMGMNIYPANYLKKLERLCRQENLLLIDDEIAMGFGRTGRMWAYQHANIRPDIVCLGKGLTGGYLPMSAAVVDREIYDAFKSPPSDRTFFHGHTFAGNPLAAAAARSALDVYEKNSLVEHVAGLSEILTEELTTLEELECVQAVQTVGLVGAVHLQGAMESSGPELARRVKMELLRCHVLIRPLGPVVYLMPPLVIESEELQNLIEKFTTTIEQLGG